MLVINDLLIFDCLLIMLGQSPKYVVSDNLTFLSDKCKMV